MLSIPIWLSPTFQKNVSPWQIVAGFVFGLLMQFLIKTFRFCRWYWNVPGRYKQERIFSDGHTERRDGEIQIKRAWITSSFKVTAYHDGHIEQWKGEMHLSLGIRNVGNGVFWHVDEGSGVGDQKFRYLPEQQQMRVQGVTFTVGDPHPFFHLWTREAGSRHGVQTRP